MRVNSNNQMILDENDIVGSWLRGNTFHTVIMDDIEPINIYNEWCRNFDVDAVITALEENSSDNYVEECLNNWHMPDEYKYMNIHQCLLDKCTTAQEKYRVAHEVQEFEQRGMITVLKFLKYLVDVCNENNIVLGVGRGSSVASYCLYLLGIHRVNSIEYDLDIKEFLK